MDFCKFKANLFYTMSFKIPGLCREIVSQNPPQANKTMQKNEINNIHSTLCGFALFILISNEILKTSLSLILFSVAYEITSR